VNNSCQPVNVDNIAAAKATQTSNKMRLSMTPVLLSITEFWKASYGTCTMLMLALCCVLLVQYRCYQPLQMHSTKALSRSTTWDGGSSIQSSGRWQAALHNMHSSSWPTRSVALVACLARRIRSTALWVARKVSDSRPRRPLLASRPPRHVE